MKYIFVHIPKTAGTAFRYSLETEFSCLYDYTPDASETSKIVLDTIYGNDSNRLRFWAEENNIDVIAGHFPANKYISQFPEAKLVTFVREPISRLLSHYNHFVRHYQYTHSLETFCSNPDHQNEQSKYLSGIKIDDFHFLGLTEEYSSSLDTFNYLSGKCLKEFKINRAKSQTRHRLEVFRKDLNEKRLNYIKACNAEDTNLYELIRRKSPVKSSNSTSRAFLKLAKLIMKNYH